MREIERERERNFLGGREESVVRKETEFK